MYLVIEVSQEMTGKLHIDKIVKKGNRRMDSYENIVGPSKHIKAFC